jgi:hypothetical protein
VEDKVYKEFVEAAAELVEEKERLGGVTDNTALRFAKAHEHFAEEAQDDIDFHRGKKRRAQVSRHRYFTVPDLPWKRPKDNEEDS